MTQKKMNLKKLRLAALLLIAVAVFGMAGGRMTIRAYAGGGLITGGNTETVAVTEAVTDENGETVTDENGDVVTETVTDENGNVVTETITDESDDAETVAVTEAVTDENGETVTDENGNVVTETVTDENGDVVTETVTDKENTSDGSVTNITQPNDESEEETGEVTEKVTTASKTGENTSDADTTDDASEGGGFVVPVMAVAVVLIVAILVAAGFLFAKTKKEENSQAADSALKAADEWGADSSKEGKAMDDAQSTKSAVEAGSPEDSRVGKVHNIGRRRNQQDTLGVGQTPMGLLAVVSDGMGGLSDGEKVSQTAVKTMLQAAQRQTGSALQNPLYELLAKANRQVLNMLGPDQIYKSGATLLAVLVSNGAFHWVTVGDSRIYFYDGKHLLQMNSEHVFKRELILQAVNERLDFSRIETNTQKGGLTSFLGMGDLKYVEGSLKPVKLAPGDKILLMSDGIFNTISEDQILGILKSTKNAAEAASLMERKVLDAENPKQDNFTCVILDI